MNKMFKEKFEDMVDEAIQNELRYDKDYITNNGWNFLENKAAKLVLKEIEENYSEDELEELNINDIENCLSDVISEYEQTHANIRYY